MDLTQNTPQSMAILGSGTWGLSLACLLHGKGIPLIAWDAFPDYLGSIEKTRKHPKLPYLDIPKGLHFTTDLTKAAHAEGLVLTVASHAVRIVCEELHEIGIDPDRYHRKR